MPAARNYWYIAILGKDHLVATNQPIPHSEILNFLGSRRFKLPQAMWQQHSSPLFRQNPFLYMGSPSEAIATSQNQISSTPDFISIYDQRKTIPPVKGYTFFIVTLDYQFIKIGFSKNPSSRFTEIQASRPDQLIYLGSFTCLRDRFEYICRKFENQHIRKGWYHLTPELNSFIETCLS